MKNQRGSVTLYVLIAMMFFLIIAMTSYASASGKLQGQNAEVMRIKASYEQDLNNESLLQLYNKVTKTREWFQGSGTLEDSYKIYKIEDLVTFSIRSNSGDFIDSGTSQPIYTYVEIMNDLDFKSNDSYANADRTDFGDINGNGTIETLKTELTTGKGFPCISNVSQDNAFTGNLAGNNHTIRNLYIYNTTNKASRSMITYVGNSMIQDLTVTGTINSTNIVIAGGLFAYNISGSTCNVQNCCNKVNLKSNKGSYSLGGIVGQVEGTINITNCHNEGNISGSNNAGGIVGYTNGVVNIDRCYNLGTIYNDLGENAGGIIGRDNAASNNTKIIKSYNEGSVSGKKYTGGLVGKINGSIEIEKCHNEAEITGTYETATYTTNTGGLAGDIVTMVTIKDSYNTGNVKSNTTAFADGSSGTIYIGGIFATIRKGELYNCYNTGTITGGQRSAGIIGTSTTGEYTTMSNCYNTGDITALSGSLSGKCAGLVEMAYKTKLDIINCYNEGAMNCNNVVGGLTGTTSATATVNIINSYNRGNLTTTASGAAGIAGVNNSNNTVNIVNTYSTGSVTTSSANKVGIIYNSSSSNPVTVNNAYFLDNVTLGQRGTITGTSTKMTQTQMTDSTLNPTFIETLNTNKNAINLGDYNITGCTLSSWKAGTDGYPVFDW